MSLNNCFTLSSKIPPDDLVVTIFHRKTAGKPAPAQSTAEKKPQPATGPRSLTVKFPQNGQDVKIQLVDASGKQLVQSVAELMRLVGIRASSFELQYYAFISSICFVISFIKVRGAHGWNESASLRFFKKTAKAELLSKSTERVLDFADGEVYVE